MIAPYSALICFQPKDWKQAFSRSLNPATVEPVLTSFAPNIRCDKPCLLPIARTIQPGRIMAPINRTSVLLAAPSQYKIFTGTTTPQANGKYHLHQLHRSQHRYELSR
jgi:hypothetical protein